MTQKEKREKWKKIKQQMKRTKSEKYCSSEFVSVIVLLLPKEEK